jgi:hypothetical protein
MELNLVHLYPRLMNTYGDTGNIICLRQRCQWRDISVVVHAVEVGDEIPREADLYFFGGGQDAAQTSLGIDLGRKATRIQDDVLSGVPMLAICGGYQLLGKFYAPFDADPIPGIEVFPVETYASHERMIGNVVIELNPAFGWKEKTAVGFENHSGKTRITASSAAPLGKVLHGFGNNGRDGTEGCVVQNAIGCYLHGSLLPKNPHLADWLLEKALTRKYPDAVLDSLDDQVEWDAHHYIVGRYTRGKGNGR